MGIDCEDKDPVVFSAHKSPENSNAINKDKLKKKYTVNSKRLSPQY